jgi:hypothetical protein
VRALDRGPDSALGLSGSRFDAARSRDTAPAYHRFVVDYPNSKYTEQAKQRIDLVRLRNQPSVAGYEAFVRAWPASPLLREVRAIVEEPVFARARARSSVEAYAEFLTEFPDGKLSARVFGVGERGLQLLDPRGGRVIESADVLARSRIATLGRHLVLVGDEWLQVVDATPFLLTPLPAALAQDGESVVAEPSGWDAFADDQDFWATPVER